MRTDGVKVVSLTPLQLGMLYHYLREGRTSGADIVQVELRLPDPVDVSRLKAAWRCVIDRTDTLRLAFRWEGGEEPVGLLHPKLKVEVHESDLSGTEDPESEFRKVLKHDRTEGLDLATPPVFRLTLYRLSDDDHRLVWTLHHILADGASYALVLEDVFRVYDEERLEPDEVALPDRPPFERFLSWLGSRAGQDDETFWRGLLSGVASSTPLPKVSGGAVDPGAWEYRFSHLSPEVTKSLREIAAFHSVTLHTMVQAAWALTLSCHSSNRDVVFGAIRGGRAGTVEGVGEMVGLFIQTVPVPVSVDREALLSTFLTGLRETWVSMRAHEHASPADLQRWSSVPAGSLLFESVINFQEPFWGQKLTSSGGAWAARTVDMHNRLVFPLTIAANVSDGISLRFEFDPSELDAERIEGMLVMMEGILARIAEGDNPRLAEVMGLSDRLRAQVVNDWNRTDLGVEGPQTVHGAFESAADASPGSTAVVHDGRTWTFEHLDREANRIAHGLRSLGVNRGDRVAVSVKRGPHMVASLLGVMKAGAAYVPVDPDYPEDRIRFMLEDSRPAAVITDRAVHPRLPRIHVRLLVVDDHVPMSHFSTERLALEIAPEDLAYVIYTSGSTGRPKGVMVEHRNVTNFFRAMDLRVGPGRGDTWLSVTSISFDISVLELFWTLSRGCRLVLHADQARRASTNSGAQAALAAPDGPGTRIDFSLFYFSAEGAEGEAPPPPGRHRYRLMLEGARFADEHGLLAVWTPERHFHEFGGIYPNPSVTAGALAALTTNVRIRSGSVVLPLHDPIRVAEEWAVVDNLSDGRVDLSFASGWHDRDFVLRPEAFADRREGMFEAIQTVHRLWRGQPVDRTGPSGITHSLSLHPRPVQPELPFWITAGGSPETFQQAGRVGGHLLTHLLGQKPDDLKERIRLYREAWEEAGHPGSGHVSLMLHTFIGPDMDFVREKTRIPFRNYLRTAVGLIKAVAADGGDDLRSTQLSAEEMDALLDHAFDRYFETSSLMGTVDRCVQIVHLMKSYGVDEIACLIDFGVDEDAVLEGLRYIPEVMARVNGSHSGSANRHSHEEGGARAVPFGSDAAVPQAPTPVTVEIIQHGITHLQCTPSQAAMILAEPRAREALARLECLCIGGEAFSGSLARRLRGSMAEGARLLNMYGPTETTIWSCVREVAESDMGLPTVPIGTPIANTKVLVLDGDGQLVPPGVEGELYIGGAGVVRGYLDRDELTRERFVERVVPEWPGRFYRTGDLVRWRANGVLEFLGRVDHQVKLLGHRIELGEIEAALDSHPNVQQAVVVLRTDDGAPETARLVAYLLSAGTLPDRSSLRAYLGERLPEVMLPAEFVELEEFPLTPNRKVDRARLPAPSEIRSPRHGEVGGSQEVDGDLNGRVAAIWKEVLGVQEIGLDNNFFDIGGHSLLAVRVHARLVNNFGDGVTLVDLFRFPTIRTLSRHLESITGVSDGDGGREAAGRAVARLEALRRRSAR